MRQLPMRLNATHIAVLSLSTFDEHLDVDASEYINTRDIITQQTWVSQRINCTAHTVSQKNVPLYFRLHSVYLLCF